MAPLTLADLKATTAQPCGYYLRPQRAVQLVHREDQCLLGRLPRDGFSCDVLIEGKVYELSKRYIPSFPGYLAKYWLMPTNRTTLEYLIQNENLSAQAKDAIQEIVDKEVA